MNMKPIALELVKLAKTINSEENLAEFGTQVYHYISNDILECTTKCREVIMKMQEISKYATKVKAKELEKEVNFILKEAKDLNGKIFQMGYLAHPKK